MAADSSKVIVELMKMKKFKKETGYEATMKKLYEQVKKGKAKTLTANIQTAKTSFTPGKGKPPVTTLIHSKVKQVKKGPAKDKVIVLATDGDAKKKTYILALRFATEENAKQFYDTAKAKGVKPPEAEQPAASTTATTPPPPPPPALSRTDERSRATSLTPSTTNRGVTPARNSYTETTRSLSRHNSTSSSVSRPTINDISAKGAAQPSMTTSSSRSYTSPVRTQTQSLSRHSRISSSSSSSSSRRQASRMSSLDPALESRTTFVSTDSNNLGGSRHHKKNRNSSTKGLTSSKVNKNEYKHYQPHAPRKSTESVRIFQLTPGRSPSKGESGRMYYYASNARDRSSSSSSFSSSTSSESIATRWFENQSAGRSRSQGRTSNYTIQSRGNLIALTQRPYSMGPGSRRRNFSSSSSSSSSSSENFLLVRFHQLPVRSKASI
ncbi:hypothetical protein TcWFU_000980 [Taenia crassiceps]|uniref:DUF5734 domain-containing protein n=1 Tax=Taenia crassiceps TaxID=6207 RepID=A0ABR4QNB0_9CEST